MKNNNAFTLLEVLLALLISSFIIVGMITIYSNLTSFIDKSSRSMMFNRKVCLLFDQMEKDLSTMFISTLQQKVKVEGEEKKESLNAEKNEETKLKQPKKVDFFSAEIYEDETQKINQKTWKLFKNINFITTNALQIYGRHKNRFVRVGYFLEKNKDLSTKDKVVYNLFRKETEDLYNQNFEESEEVIIKKSKYTVSVDLIADKIKNLFIEYVTLQEDPDKKLREEESEKKSFIWDKKDTLSFQRVDIKVIFWDERLIGEYSFDCFVPLFIKKVKQPQESKTKKEEAKVDEKSKASEKTEDAKTE